MRTRRWWGILPFVVLLAVTAGRGCGDPYAAFGAQHEPPAPEQPPAQEPPPATPPAPAPAPPPATPDWSQINWRTLIAGFLNAVGVIGVVQLVKALAPWMRAAIPWTIPIVAMLAGPVVAIIQSLLGDWLGLPIDLSPILGPLSGGAAVALYQVGKQTRPHKGGPLPG